MKKIVTTITMMMLFVMIGCTSSNVKKVRDGKLYAFGDEVTIGEVFDVVSGNTTSWEEEELGGKSNMVLVDAKWDGEGGKVLVQFMINKTEDEFYLNAATLGGQPVDAYSVIHEIKSEYNKRSN